MFLRVLVLLGVLLSATAVAPIAYADDDPSTPSATSGATSGGTTEGTNAVDDPSGSDVHAGPGDPLTGPVTPNDLPLSAQETTPTPEAQEAVAADAPVATITSGPARPVAASSSATFTFTADQSDATFRCKLTGTGQSATTFTPCASPKTYTGLRGGNYLLTVHAVAADGTTAGLDATYAWRIENCTNKASLCPVFSPDHYSVKSGATFNNPTGTTTARRRNLNNVIRTINSMPGYRVASQAVLSPEVYPSTIRITLYSADRHGLRQGPRRRQPPLRERADPDEQPPRAERPPRRSPTCRSTWALGAHLGGGTRRSFALPVQLRLPGARRAAHEDVPLRLHPDRSPAASGSATP